MEQAIKTNITTRKVRDKVVVITGASSGAGRAIALEFAKNGAKVVIAARNIKELNKVEAECREYGSVALAVKTDVTDYDQVKELATTAAELGNGVIDVWVNNAGVLAVGEFDNTPIEIHDHVIKTNLLGYIKGAHAVLPLFKARQKGILINNISVGGWFPVPYGVAYTAAKYGLTGFSEALRGELTEYHAIHVCDVFPGFLDTPGVQHAANYTGHILRPAPPVYNPQRVAKAIVSLAERPRPSVTIGAMASFLKIANALFPTLSRSITAKTVRAYLKKADPAPETSGNVFSHAEYGTSIYGGWNSPADMEIRRKALIRSAIVTVLAGGLVLLGKNQLAKKKQLPGY